MFRTVFSRLIAVFTAVVLVTMGIQGLFLDRVHRRETVVRAQDSMMEEARGVAGLIGRYLGTHQGQKELYAYISACSRANHASVWFVNGKGVISLVAEDGADRISEMPEVDTFTQQEMETYLLPILESKELSAVGSFRGRFDRDMVTVGSPVFLGRDMTVGAVYLHIPLASLVTDQGTTAKMILFCGAFAAILAAGLIFMTARSITQPLSNINRAVREIAHGKLDVKVQRGGPTELGQLADSFNRMAEELKKQEATHISFVANVSHELKSPMTSIQGFTQGMVDGTIPPEEHPKYLNIILGETRRLTKLVRELLDLSQVESGTFSLRKTTFDINELIRRVLIRYLDALEEKQIEPEIEFRQEYCYVEGDSDRIEQVLVNLIDNAIRFTLPGGQIRIWTHNSTDKVLVSVSDSGLGIPEEDLPYIFDRFYKADKSHTDKKGTGLGLAIVKSILEQHGESIQVTSKLGSGTTFAFTMKRADHVPTDKPGLPNEKKDESTILS